LVLDFTIHSVSVNPRCLEHDGSYTGGVPRLWNDTIDAHRRAVRDATIDTTAALVVKHGLRTVTMAQIAAETGIGRATLYKYFPDIESILLAWHERQIAAHREQLAALGHQGGPAAKRLEAVLETFALIQHQHHDNELAALLHRGGHVPHAEQHLKGLLRGLLGEAAAAGNIRKDVPPDELATYCLHALTAAGRLGSKPAVQRLVKVTLAGLRR
jgi:AcrR family transcriptional regulator